MDHAQQKALDSIFARYDTDQNKHLDYPEVKRLLSDVYKTIGHGEPTDADIKEFVRVADLNGDGVVSKMELARIFHEMALPHKLPKK